MVIHTISATLSFFEYIFSDHDDRRVEGLFVTYHLESSVCKRRQLSSYVANATEEVVPGQEGREWDEGQRSQAEREESQVSAPQWHPFIGVVQSPGFDAREVVDAQNVVDEAKDNQCLCDQSKQRSETNTGRPDEKIIAWTIWKPAFPSQRTAGSRCWMGYIDSSMRSLFCIKWIHM
jgi:hypothetical protein